jgi:hypothetical protein
MMSTLSFGAIDARRLEESRHPIAPIDFLRERKMNHEGREGHDVCF